MAINIDVQVKLLKGEVDASSSTASVPVVFRFTNLEAETVTFLKWNTPLESQFPVFKSPFLNVARKGDKSATATYVGIIINRRPTMEDFVTIPAGGSVEVNFDLMKGYAFTTAGVYEVELTTTVRARRGADQIYKELAAGVFDLMSLEEFPLTHAVMPLMVTHPNTEIRVGEFELGTGVNDTTGAVPTKSCTSAQTSTISNAGAGATTIASHAFSAASGNNKAGAAYVKWFGAYDVTRSNTVQNTYKAARDRLQSVGYSVDCAGSSCSANTYAYVFPSDSTHTIYVCGVFWKVATATCTIDSQPGTLVHEMTHFADVGKTQDHAYGTTACQNLATTSPAKAVNNADNYEYYAESCPPI